MANFIRSFFLLISLFSAISCSVKEHKKIDSEDKFESTDTLNTPVELVLEGDIQTNSYQLGDEWNRVPTQAFHDNHNTVLRAIVGSPDGKVSSNFILLEKINKTEAYFIGTVHSLASPCVVEGISFKTKDKTLVAECNELHSIVPETDIVIFSVKFYAAEDLEPLKPVSIVNKNFLFGERLRFFGIDSDDLIPDYYPLITDSHKDCRLISNTEEKIFDPDELNTITDDSFWSYAVTCDVKHGDSGGMFVDRDGDLVGVLWTGAFPKKSDYNSAAILNFINEGNEVITENLWTDFNYVTPAYRILDHLESIKAEL